MASRMRVTSLMDEGKCYQALPVAPKTIGHHTKVSSVGRIAFIRQAIPAGFQAARALVCELQSNFNWPEGRCATFAFARYLQITGTSHLQPGIECFERALLSSNRFLFSLASRVILPPTPVRRPPPRRAGSTQMAHCWP